MKKKYVILAALATMLAACNNEESVPQVDGMADTPVRVNAGVAELTSRASALETGSMGLFFATAGTDAAETKYNAANREVRYEGGWTIQGTPLLWKGADAGVTYYAYHPFTDAVSGNLVPVTVSAVQTAETIGREDFLYAPSQTLTAVPASGAIDIAFAHKLAKLTVTLTKGDELEGTTFASVTIGNVICQGSFDLAAGVWEAADAAATAATVTMKPTGSDGSTFEALLMPQTVDFKVTITTDNGRAFTYTYGSAYAFEPGNAYGLALRAGKDIVETVAVSVGAWKTDADHQDDSLETE